VVAEITRLENEWVTAIKKKDVAALENLLAEDFNGTSPTGVTFPRTDAIEDLKSGAYVVESMDLDELSVNVYGDTVVVFTSQQEKSKYDGIDNSGHYHFTNVWVKRDGKWKVVASHGSRYGK
jgi:ketosteroid isomerase-like protein